MMGKIAVTPRFGWGWNQHEQINEIFYKALPQDSSLRDFLNKHHKAIAKACEEEDKISYHSKRSHVVHLDDIEHNAPPIRRDKNTITLEGVSQQFGPQQHQVMARTFAAELRQWESSLWKSNQNVLGLFQQYTKDLTEVMKQPSQDERAIAVGVGRLLHLVDMAQPFHTTQWYKWPLVLGNHTFDSHGFSESIKLIGNGAKTQMANEVIKKMGLLQRNKSLRPEFTAMVARSYLRLFDLWKHYAVVAKKEKTNPRVFGERLQNLQEPLEEKWRSVLQQSAVEGVALVGVVLERLFNTYPIRSEKCHQEKSLVLPETLTN